MGRLLDRFGPRRTTAVVVLLFGAACLALGAAANLVWLAAGFAALRCLGMGALMLGCTNLVSQWFSRRRGFALSLMALGFAASMAIHPPPSQYLVDALAAGLRCSAPHLGAAAADPPARPRLVGGQG